MVVRRPILTALILALLGTLWLSGSYAGADELLPAESLRGRRHRDLFADELDKRQLAEARDALCPASDPSGRNARTAGGGQGGFARDAHFAPVFPDPAEPRRGLLRPADAAAPAPSVFALPPARSPPLN